MTRLIIIFIFSLKSITLSSQYFGRIYIDFPQKYAEKELDKQIKKGLKKKSISFSSKSMNGDTLIYTIKNNAECFIIKMTFNFKNEILEENDCDIQEYIFDCPACSQKHLQEIISEYQFRQKSENVYLSRYFDKMEMTVQYSPTNKDYLILTFKRVDLPEEEFKTLYKKLKKI
jgi:hypothetical protein